VRIYVVLFVAVVCFFFFFSSRRRHTRFSRDWSSDVCSSDLEVTDVRASWFIFFGCNAVVSILFQTFLLVQSRVFEENVEIDSETNYFTPPNFAALPYP